MKNARSTVRAGIDVFLPPAAAFEVLVDELASALGRLGIRFESGPNGGVFQGTNEVGRVVSWEPQNRILLEWRQASWEPEELTEVELRLESIGGGSA